MRARAALGLGLLALTLAGCGGQSIEARTQARVRETSGNVHLRVSDCVATVHEKGMSAFDRWDCILSDPSTGARRSITVGYWPDNDVQLEP